MDVVHSRCCGIDIHKRTLCACISIKDGSEQEKHKRRFGTTTDELRQLAAWLVEWRIGDVAMEATGVYWKPVWNVLKGQFKLLLANPQHLKAIPGKKTDFKDGERIADLMQHGLLHGSFVPPQRIRELRDLTRTRAKLAQERSRIVNRIQKVLEDANLKLACVATDVLGASGRLMIEALIAGERDSRKLAELSKGALRGKIPELVAALEGEFTQHHRFLLQQWIEMLGFIERKIAEFDERIADQALPFEPMVMQWIAVPGLKRTNAYGLVAEIGANMEQFPSAGHLASWATICPGNNESAGKQLGGRTRKGKPWLRRTLCEAAWGASHAKRSYFRALYHRLVRHRGKNRAIVAVAHSLLVTIYSFTKAGTAFEDLGVNYFDRINREALESRLVKRLVSLGNKVTLEPVQPRRASPA
jgi:transposase